MSVRVCLLVVVFSSFVGTFACCMILPSSQYVGARPYYLRQSTECRGAKVYEINNVQDVDQCKEACAQFDCAAVNLFQISEFQFMCEILGNVYSYVPAQGAACYVGQ